MRFFWNRLSAGEQIGRFTFLGARPYMRVRSAQGKVEIHARAASRSRFRKMFSRWSSGCCGNIVRQPYPGLPPFTAGAVGYFAYDVVRQLEKIGEHAKDDLHLPDAELMFFDRLLAFDHLRHQIHIVAAADVPGRHHGERTTAHCEISPRWSGNWRAG